MRCPSARLPRRKDTINLIIGTSVVRGGGGGDKIGGSSLS